MFHYLAEMNINNWRFEMILYNLLRKTVHEFVNKLYEGILYDKLTR